MTDKEVETEPPVELVAAMYEAAVEPAQWRPVLERLTAYFHSGIGILWTHDFSDDTVHLASEDPWCIVGADDASVRSFVSYYSSRSVWAPKSRHLGEGQTIVSSALYPDSLLPRTEYYCDWLRPLDLRFGIGSAVIKQEMRDVKLSFARCARAGAFTPVEQHRLRALLPHMKSALYLQRKIRNARLLADASCAALDQLTFGVVLLTRDGHVFHANRAAEALASQSGAFSFQRGTVQCPAPRDTEAVGALVKEATLTAAGVGRLGGGAMKLRGRHGAVPVVVAPLPMTKSPFGAPVSAVLFCNDPRASRRTLAQVLKALHGFTPAEARLATGLMDGLSVQEFADAERLSIHTVRSQLKALCQKTGTRRQAELVRLLLNSVPPAHAGSREMQ